MTMRQSVNRFSSVLSRLLFLFEFLYVFFFEVRGKPSEYILAFIKNSFSVEKKSSGNTWQEQYHCLLRRELIQDTDKDLLKGKRASF